MASGVFGMLIGTIGIVPTGEWRATFNKPYLADGLPIVPVLIGMFVFSELMLMTFRDYVIDSTVTVKRSLLDIFSGFRLPRVVLPAFFRSTGLGIVVGLLPAAGGTAASFAAYSLRETLSKRSEEYGKGSVEGVVASESANNACSGGDIMTTLVLGVPGSATTGDPARRADHARPAGRAELRRPAAGARLRHHRRGDHLAGLHGRRRGVRAPTASPAP